MISCILFFLEQDNFNNTDVEDAKLILKHGIYYKFTIIYNFTNCALFFYPKQYVVLYAVTHI